MAAQFLDIMEQGTLQGDLSESLLLNVCQMVTKLRHEYPHTKTICIKMLLSCSPGLLQKRFTLLLEILASSCVVSKEECLQLSLGKNVPPKVVLSLLWVNCISCKHSSEAATATAIEYGIISKYLEGHWHNEVLKYIAVGISLWNATEDTGHISQLLPDFIE
jgi:hypothetical protein